MSKKKEMEEDATRAAYGADMLSDKTPAGEVANEYFFDGLAPDPNKMLDHLIFPGRITELDFNKGVGKLFFEQSTEKREITFPIDLLSAANIADPQEGEELFFKMDRNGNIKSFKNRNLSATIRISIKEKTNNRDLIEEDSPDDRKKSSNEKLIVNVDSKEREEELRRVFAIFSELPTGEIRRIADTAEKRLEKWPADVPKSAPELYQQRPASEDLPSFLRRVYGQNGFLNGSLTTAHLDIIDPAVARAIRSWVEHHGSLPDDINLPNKVKRPKGTGAKRSEPSIE